jgi:hypothetical protein
MSQSVLLGKPPGGAPVIRFVHPSRLPMRQRCATGILGDLSAT